MASRPRELTLRDRVCRDARHRLGVVSLQLELRNHSGWPDRLFLTPHRPLWLELKRPGQQPRPLQVARLETLVSLGYIASVGDGWTDSYDAAMERIEKALEWTP